METPKNITIKPLEDKRKRAKLLWIDLEMTGLDPKVDKIVEVAAIGTDWDFEPLCEFTATVKIDENFMKSHMVGEFWEKNAASRDAMLAANKNGDDTKIVEKALLDFLDDNFAQKSIENYPEKIILAGNSIHQDRRFIENEWPKLNARLHYRMLDVSAWKVYFEGALGKKFLKPEAHRALDDIRGSIAELKHYVSKIEKGKL